jgi:hypothetical protein
VSDVAGGDARERGAGVALPAPTAWPLVVGFGITLTFAGLVTHPAIGALGLALALVGTVGGVRQVIPVERHERVPLRPEPPAPRSARALPELAEQRHRLRIPEEIHPYSAGAWGGLVGGLAMGAVAVAYGLLRHRSPWLPINLLAAVALPSLAGASLAELRAFSAQALLLASGIHVFLSVGVGLLYGVLLPMLPGRSAAWGALVAPVLWSSVLGAALPLVNPTLASRIAWGWFVASQVAFGAVAGLCVARARFTPVLQRLPRLRPQAGESGREDGP